jgi:hypothetical protein
MVAVEHPTFGAHRLRDVRARVLRTRGARDEDDRDRDLLHGRPRFLRATTTIPSATAAIVPQGVSLFCAPSAQPHCFDAAPPPPVDLMWLPDPPIVIVQSLVDEHVPPPQQYGCASSQQKPSLQSFGADDGHAEHDESSPQLPPPQHTGKLESQQ